MSKQTITDKKLIKQAEIWRQDALMTPAAYRLYVYTKLENIPPEIVIMLEQEAVDIWDEQISFDDIDTDIELTIGRVFTSLASRRVMESFLFVPLLLADLFVLGKGASRLEGRYRKLINEYAAMTNYDRPLAEIEAIYALSDLMLEVAKKIDLNLNYDVEEVISEILLQQELLDKPNTLTNSNVNLSTIVDKALEDYEKETGKSALEDVEDGVDIEELQKEIDKLVKETKKDEA